MRRTWIRGGTGAGIILLLSRPRRHPGHRLPSSRRHDPVRRRDPARRRLLRPLRGDPGRGGRRRGGPRKWIETQAVDGPEETQALVDDIFEKKVINLADGGVGEARILVGDGVQEAVLAYIGDEETQVLLDDGAQEEIFEQKAGNLAGPDGRCGDGDEETQILVEDGVGEATFEEKGGDLAASDASIDAGIGGGEKINQKCLHLRTRPYGQVGTLTASKGFDGPIAPVHVSAGKPLLHLSIKDTPIGCYRSKTKPPRNSLRM